MQIDIKEMDNNKLLALEKLIQNNACNWLYRFKIMNKKSVPAICQKPFRQCTFDAQQHLSAAAYLDANRAVPFDMLSSQNSLQLYQQVGPASIHCPTKEPG